MWRGIQSIIHALQKFACYLRNLDAYHKSCAYELSCVAEISKSVHVGRQLSPRLACPVTETQPSSRTNKETTRSVYHIIVTHIALQLE